MKSIRIFLLVVFCALPFNYLFAVHQDDNGYEYAIQILTSKKHVDAADKKFKGVNDVREEIIDGVYKYTTGKFKSAAEATDLMTKMQTLGFKGAFIVRYKDGQRAPVTTETKTESKKPVAEAAAAKSAPGMEENVTPAPTQVKPAPVKTSAAPATKTGKKDKPIVGSSMVHKEPEFKGGNDSLTRFVTRNLQYPEKRFSRTDDAVVLISFTVDTIGKIKNVRVVNGLSKELDAEALRLVQSMPDWEPGTIGGMPAEMECFLPVSFYR